MYVLHVLICGDNGISRDPLDVCFGDQLAGSAHERHTSSVLKSFKTQSDEITSKGKLLNPLQESRGGETS